MHNIALDIALIGVLGVGAQWVAWRTQLPAIVILLLTGFLVGPASGLLDPQASFGELLTPFISIAVAIILFEGGLTLNFEEIRETSPAVRRLILIGAPATWGLGFLAAYYLAGLSPEAAAVLSGIMVVTGPTVIMPLLRQARLPRKPASLLRWEAIVADPIGALFAVIAYEAVVALQTDHSLLEVGLRLGGAVALGTAIALAMAWAITFAFVRAKVPEFLKAPIMLVAVVLGFSLTNLVLEEAGLLTVTIFGIALANRRLASLDEMRRFKEVITVILVSSLFIVLTAATTLEDIASIGWRDAAFLAAMLFVIRPVVVLGTTLTSSLDWRERLLCAWIAPRGVVAVAVSGLFAQALLGAGVEDASRMVPLAFLVVIATVLLHGFSIRPLARALGLTSKEPPGLLLIGGNPWTTALAEKLREIEMPVLIADSNWNHLIQARRADIPVYYGEILSEAAEHHLDLSRYGAMIAASDNDAYNALVCTDLGPEIGRSHVFQLGRTRTQENGSEDDAPRERAERHQLHFTVGGRLLFGDGSSHGSLQRKITEGWEFRATKLTDEFGYDAYLESRAEEAGLLFALRKGAAQLSFFGGDRERFTPGAGDTIVSFGPPKADEEAANEGPVSANS